MGISVEEIAQRYFFEKSNFLSVPPIPSGSLRNSGENFSASAANSYVPLVFPQAPDLSATVHPFGRISPSAANSPQLPPQSFSDVNSKQGPKLPSSKRDPKLSPGLSLRSSCSSPPIVVVVDPISPPEVKEPHNSLRSALLLSSPLVQFFMAEHTLSATLSIRRRQLREQRYHGTPIHRSHFNTTRSNNSNPLYLMDSQRQCSSREKDGSSMRSSQDKKERSSGGDPRRSSMVFSPSSVPAATEEGELNRIKGAGCEKNAFVRSGSEPCPAAGRLLGLLGNVTLNTFVLHPQACLSRSSTSDASLPDVIAEQWNVQDQLSAYSEVVDSFLDQCGDFSDVKSLKLSCDCRVGTAAHPLYLEGRKWCSCSYAYWDRYVFFFPDVYANFSDYTTFSLKTLVSELSPLALQGLNALVATVSQAHQRGSDGPSLHSLSTVPIDAHSAATAPASPSRIPARSPMTPHKSNSFFYRARSEEMGHRNAFSLGASIEESLSGATMAGHSYRGSPGVGTPGVNFADGVGNTTYSSQEDLLTATRVTGLSATYGDTVYDTISNVIKSLIDLGDRPLALHVILATCRDRPKNRMLPLFHHVLEVLPSIKMKTVVLAMEVWRVLHHLSQKDKLYEALGRMLVDRLVEYLQHVRSHNSLLTGLVGISYLLSWTSRTYSKLLAKRLQSILLAVTRVLFLAVQRESPLNASAPYLTQLATATLKKVFFFALKNECFSLVKHFVAQGISCIVGPTVCPVGKNCSEDFLQNAEHTGDSLSTPRVQSSSSTLRNGSLPFSQKEPEAEAPIPNRHFEKDKLSQILLNDGKPIGTLPFYCQSPLMKSTKTPLSRQEGPNKSYPVTFTESNSASFSVVGEEMYAEDFWELLQSIRELVEEHDGPLVGSFVLGAFLSAWHLHEKWKHSTEEAKSDSADASPLSARSRSQKLAPSAEKRFTKMGNEVEEHRAPKDRPNTATSSLAAARKATSLVPPRHPTVFPETENEFSFAKKQATDQDKNYKEPLTGARDDHQTCDEEDPRVNLSSVEEDDDSRSKSDSVGMTLEDFVPFENALWILEVTFAARSSPSVSRGPELPTDKPQASTNSYALEASRVSTCKPHSGMQCQNITGFDSSVQESMERLFPLLMRAFGSRIPTSIVLRAVMASVNRAISSVKKEMVDAEAADGASSVRDSESPVFFLSPTVHSQRNRIKKKRVPPKSIDHSTYIRSSAIEAAAVCLSAVAPVYPSLFEGVLLKKFFPCLALAVNERSPCYSPYAYPALGLLVHNLPCSANVAQCTSAVEYLCQEALRNSLTPFKVAITEAITSVLTELSLPTEIVMKHLIGLKLDAPDHDENTNLLKDGRNEPRRVGNYSQLSGNSPALKGPLRRHSRSTDFMVSTVTSQESVKGFALPERASKSVSPSFSASSDTSPLHKQGQKGETSVKGGAGIPTSEKLVCLHLLEDLIPLWDMSVEFVVQHCLTYTTHKESKLRWLSVRACSLALLHDWASHAVLHADSEPSKTNEQKSHDADSFLGSSRLGCVDCAFCHGNYSKKTPPSSWGAAERGWKWNTHDDRRWGCPNTFLNMFEASQVLSPIVERNADGAPRSPSPKFPSFARLTYLREAIEALAHVAECDPVSYLRWIALKSLRVEHIDLLYPHITIVNSLFVIVNDSEKKNRAEAVRILIGVARRSPSSVFPRLQGLFLRKLEQFARNHQSEVSVRTAHHRSSLGSSNPEGLRTVATKLDSDAPNEEGLIYFRDDASLLLDISLVVLHFSPLYVSHLLTLLRIIFQHSSWYGREAVIKALWLLKGLHEDSFAEEGPLFKPFLDIVAQQLKVRDGDNVRLLATIAALLSLYQSKTSEFFLSSGRESLTISQLLVSLYFQEQHVSPALSVAILKLSGRISVKDLHHSDGGSGYPHHLQKPRDLFVLPTLSQLASISLEEKRTKSPSSMIHISKTPKDAVRYFSDVVHPLYPFSYLMWPDLVIRNLANALLDYLNYKAILNPDDIYEYLVAILNLIEKTTASQRGVAHLTSFLNIFLHLAYLTTSDHYRLSDFETSLLIFKLASVVSTLKESLSPIFSLLHSLAAHEWNSENFMKWLSCLHLVTTLATFFPELVKPYSQMWVNELMNAFHRCKGMKPEEAPQVFELYQHSLTLDPRMIDEVSLRMEEEPIHKTELLWWAMAIVSIRMLEALHIILPVDSSSKFSLLSRLAAMLITSGMLSRVITDDSGELTNGSIFAENVGNVFRSDRDADMGELGSLTVSSPRPGLFLGNHVYSRIDLMHITREHLAALVNRGVTRLIAACFKTAEGDVSESAPRVLEHSLVRLRRLADCHHNAMMVAHAHYRHFSSPERSSPNKTPFDSGFLLQNREEYEKMLITLRQGIDHSKRRREDQWAETSLLWDVRLVPVRSGTAEGRETQNIIDFPFDAVHTSWETCAEMDMLGVVFLCLSRGGDAVKSFQNHVEQYIHYRFGADSPVASFFEGVISPLFECGLTVPQESKEGTLFSNDPLVDGPSKSNSISDLDEGSLIFSPTLTDPLQSVLDPALLKQAFEEEGEEKSGTPLASSPMGVRESSAGKSIQHVSECLQVLKKAQMSTTSDDWEEDEGAEYHRVFHPMSGSFNYTSTGQSPFFGDMLGHFSTRDLMQFSSGSEWKAWFDRVSAFVLDSCSEPCTLICEPLIKSKRAPLLFSDILNVSFASVLSTFNEGQLSLFFQCIRKIYETIADLPVTVASQLFHLLHFVHRFGGKFLHRYLFQRIVKAELPPSFLAHMAKRALQPAFRALYVEMDVSQRPYSRADVNLLVEAYDDLLIPYFYNAYTMTKHKMMVFFSADNADLYQRILANQEALTEEEQHFLNRGVEGQCSRAVLSPLKVLQHLKMVDSLVDALVHTSYSATLLSRLGYVNASVKQYLRCFQTVLSRNRMQSPSPCGKVYREKEIIALLHHHHDPVRGLEVKREGFTHFLDQIVKAMQSFASVFDFHSLLALWNRAKMYVELHCVSSSAASTRMRVTDEGLEEAANTSRIGRPAPYREPYFNGAGLGSGGAKGRKCTADDESYPSCCCSDGEKNAPNASGTDVSQYVFHGDPCQLPPTELDLLYFLQILRYTTEASTALSEWDVTLDLTNDVFLVSQLLRSKDLARNAEPLESSKKEAEKRRPSAAYALDPEGSAPFQESREGFDSPANIRVLCLAQLDINRSMALIANSEYSKGKQLLKLVQTFLMKENAYSTLQPVESREKEELMCMYQQITDLEEGVQQTEIKCTSKSGPSAAVTEEMANKRLYSIACSPFLSNMSISQCFRVLAARSAIVPPLWQIKNTFVLSEQLHLRGMPLRASKLLSDLQYPTEAKPVYPTRTSSPRDLRGASGLTLPGGEDYRDFENALRLERYRLLYNCLPGAEDLKQLQRTIVSVFRYNVRQRSEEQSIENSTTPRSQDRIVLEDMPSSFSTFQAKLLLLALRCNDKISLLQRSSSGRLSLPSPPPPVVTSKTLVSRNVRSRSSSALFIIKEDGSMHPTTRPTANGEVGAAGEPSEALQYNGSENYAGSMTGSHPFIDCTWSSAKMSLETLLPHIKVDPYQFVVKTLPVFHSSSSSRSEQSLLLEEYHLLERCMTHSVTSIPAVWRDFSLVLFDVCLAIREEHLRTKDSDTLFNYLTQSKKAIVALQRAAMLWSTHESREESGVGSFGSTCRMRTQQAREGLSLVHLLSKSLYLASLCEEDRERYRTTTREQAKAELSGTMSPPLPRQAAGFADLDFSPPTYHLWLTIAPLLIGYGMRHEGICKSLMGMCQESLYMARQFLPAFLGALEHSYPTLLGRGETIVPPSSSLERSSASEPRATSSSREFKSNVIASIAAASPAHAAIVRETVRLFDFSKNDTSGRTTLRLEGACVLPLSSNNFVVAGAYEFGMEQTGPMERKGTEKRIHRRKHSMERDEEKNVIECRLSTYPLAANTVLNPRSVLAAFKRVVERRDVCGGLVESTVIISVLKQDGSEAYFVRTPVLGYDGPSDDSPLPIRSLPSDSVSMGTQLSGDQHFDYPLTFLVQAPAGGQKGWETAPDPQLAPHPFGTSSTHGSAFEKLTFTTVLPIPEDGDGPHDCAEGASPSSSVVYSHMSREASLHPQSAHGSVIMPFALMEFVVANLLSFIPLAYFRFNLILCVGLQVMLMELPEKSNVTTSWQTTLFPSTLRQSSNSGSHVSYSFPEIFQSYEELVHMEEVASVGERTLNSDSELNSKTNIFEMEGTVRKDHHTTNADLSSNYAENYREYRVLLANAFDTKDPTSLLLYLEKLLFESEEDILHARVRTCESSKERYSMNVSLPRCLKELKFLYATLRSLYPREGQDIDQLQQLRKSFLESADPGSCGTDHSEVVQESTWKGEAVQRAILQVEYPRFCGALSAACDAEKKDASQWIESRQGFTHCLAEMSLVEYILNVENRSCDKFFLNPVSSQVGAYQFGMFSMRSKYSHECANIASAALSPPPNELELGGHSSTGEEDHLCEVIGSDPLSSEQPPGDGGHAPLYHSSSLESLSKGSALCGVLSPKLTRDPCLFRLTRSMEKALLSETVTGCFLSRMAEGLYDLQHFRRHIEGALLFGVSQITPWAWKLPKDTPGTSRKSRALSNPVVQPCFDTASVVAKLSFFTPLNAEGDTEPRLKAKEMATLRWEMKTFTESSTAATDSPGPTTRTLSGKLNSPWAKRSQDNLAWMLEEEATEAKSEGDDRCFDAEQRKKARIDNPSAYDMAYLLIQIARDERSLIGSEACPHSWNSWAPHW